MMWKAVITLCALVAAQEIPKEIICHSQSCQEVKAQLATIRDRQKIAKDKLNECSVTRQKLHADLIEAAKARGKAEQALAKCAEDRSKLEAELRQCSEIDRPNAEKALAQCAVDRAELEEELRQCAEVDRPAAEKALAQCAIDRGKLEADLAKLVAKAKETASGKSARRRRRRSKRFSLTAISTAANATEAGEGESQSDVEEVQAELARLDTQFAVFQNARNRVDERLRRTKASIDEVSQRESKTLAQLGKEQEREAAKQRALKKVEEELGGIIARSQASDKGVTKAEQALDAATKRVGKASADAASLVGAETQVLLQLISLAQEEHRVLHANVASEHRNNTALLASQDDTVQVLANTVAGGLVSEAQCNDLRAEVITAKEKLRETDSALQACLTAKMEIQAKIDTTLVLQEQAQQGLQKCLDTKQELQNKIKFCHERRDEAREKLQQCLDRKKVLKTLIAECHKKRDEAREKLQQCLDRKKVLKAKINKLPQVRLLEGGDASVQDAALLAGDAEEYLRLLHQGNLELQDVVKEFSALSLEERNEIRKMAEVTKDQDVVAAAMTTNDQDEEAAETLFQSVKAQLMTVFEELERSGTEIQGAVNANEASSQRVAAVEEKLSALF